MSADVFAARLEADYQALKLRRAGTSFPATANRASSAGHPCARYLVLERLNPEKKPPIDARLATLFDEGRIQERALVADLAEMGYDVERWQRALAWPALQLVGHPDFNVRKDGEGYVGPGSAEALDGVGHVLIFCKGDPQAAADAAERLWEHEEALAGPTEAEAVDGVGGDPSATFLPVAPDRERDPEPAILEEKSGQLRMF